MSPNNKNSYSSKSRLINGLTLEYALSLLAITNEYIDDPNSKNEDEFLNAFEEAIKVEQLTQDQIRLLRKQFQDRGVNVIRVDRSSYIIGRLSRRLQENEIKSFYKDIFLPAFVTDSLLYFNAVNDNFMRLFEVSKEFFIENLSKSAGTHLLYFFFHPHIRVKLGEGWKNLVIFYIFIFRIRSKEKANSQEYFDLLNILVELPDFREIWELTENLTYLPMSPPHIFKLQSLELGEVSCFHSEILVPVLPTAPIEYPDPKFFAVYVPADINTEQSFTNLYTTPRVAYLIEKSYVTGVGFEMGINTIDLDL